MTNTEKKTFQTFHIISLLWDYEQEEKQLLDGVQIKSMYSAPVHRNERPCTKRKDVDFSKDQSITIVVKDIMHI